MNSTTRKARTTSGVSRTEFDALVESVQALVALVSGEAPAKAPRTRKATTKKATPAKRATAKKATTKATPATVKCVTRKTRPAFVKENPEYAGQTTGQIQQAMLEGGSWNGAWTVGPRTVAFFETGSYPESTPKAAKGVRLHATPKAERKAAKVKATKATRVTAAVKPAAKAKATWSNDGLEYGSEAWIKATPIHADEAPKNAKGKFTPKGEWALRCKLHADGGFSVPEIDAVVAATN